MSASIVAFNDDPTLIAAVLTSALAADGADVVYVIDNSSDRALATSCRGERAEYLHMGRNLGYGRGHNVAIRRAVAAGATYHVIMNPDIDVGPAVPATLRAYMDTHPDVGVVMPQVRSPQGAVQYLCKRDPRPADLLARRFLPARLQRLVRGRLERYEMRGLPQDRASDVPNLSGCFMFARTAALEAVGGFDERYFLYLEDYDLCREVRRAGYRVVYLPTVSIVHLHGRASYRRLRPMLLHITSAVRYFNKWGWWPLW